MQFFSSAKRTALISTQPDYPQMLQKNSKFGCITHWLPKKQQYTDPAATNITSTKASWGDSFFLHLGKTPRVWRLFCPGTCGSWVLALFQHQHWAERCLGPAEPHKAGQCYGRHTSSRSTHRPRAHTSSWMVMTWRTSDLGMYLPKKEAIETFF